MTAPVDAPAPIWDPAPGAGPLVIGLLAAALLAAGGRPGTDRLRALLRAPGRAAVPDPPLRRRWIAVGATAAGVLVWTVAGAGAGVVAGGLAGLAGAAAAHLTSRPRPAPADTTDLATAWELVAVGLAAGLPVALAVSAAAEPLGGTTGGRLRRVGGLLELGADPAQAWRVAEDDAALAAFARAAGRSAATGAGLADAARAEAARLRSTLADAAQERAQRAGVLITGPLGLCFLPAFLVLGIAPVVAGLAGEALAQW